jgi:BirA family transcriptional regulator, biotin operon repressor / biotin---[acetyl-CoA-carboxylase] ligase
MTWSLERVGIVDSTMHIAQERARAGAASGTTFVAEGQTHGRGRRGRNWFSPPGTGLWFTTLLRPANTHTEISTLALVIGIAVQKALAAFGTPGVGLKWPNDLCAEQRKLGGILLESYASGDDGLIVLVGVGVNLARTDAETLPAEIQQRYIGLADLIGNIPRDTVLEMTLQHMQTCYHLWSSEGFGPFVKIWEDHDVLFGRQVSAEVNGQRMVGTCSGIQADGALKLVTPAGVQNVYAGEVEKVEGSYDVE